MWDEKKHKSCDHAAEIIHIPKGLSTIFVFLMSPWIKDAAKIFFSSPQLSCPDFFGHNLKMAIFRLG
jgi:hypothetical protein